MTSKPTYASLSEMIRSVGIALSLCAILAACDTTTPVEDQPAVTSTAPAASGTLVQMQGQALNLGYAEEAQVLPSFSNSASFNIPSAAYASVSAISVSGTSSHNPSVPTSIALSPTGVTATINGQTKTSTFESNVRTAMADFTARVDAELGTPVVARLPDGRNFGALSFRERVEVMQQRGFEVEDLGDGRFRLTRGAEAQARSGALDDGVEVSLIVQPGAQALYPEAEVRMGGQLIYEQGSASSRDRPSLLVGPAGPGGSQRTVQFGTAGSSQ